MKRIKKLLTMFLTICMLASSIIVYGADENATGDNKTHGTGTNNGAVGGASQYKTGIAMYLVTKEKTSDSYIFYPKSVSLRPDSTSVDHDRFTTKFGESKIEGIEPYNSMPQPVKHSDSKGFYGNYWGTGGIHDWLTATDPSTGRKRYDLMANKYFKEQYEKAVANKEEMSICFEGVAWHSLFRTGDKTSGTPKQYLNTATGWAKHKIDAKIKGSTFTDALDNDVLPHLMKLERKQFGWKVDFAFNTAGSGTVPNERIVENAYGINIFNLNPMTSTKTPTPAPMKSDNGTYSVIKCYEDIIPPVEGEESAEPQYQHKASYINTKAPERLYIESEEEYTVTDWEVIKEKVENINPSDSYDAITSGKTPTNTGNGDSEVSLCEESPTVVIRLRQGAELNIPPKDIALSGDKEITESKITQSFSDVAANSLRFVGN